MCKLLTIDTERESASLELSLLSLGGLASGGTAAFGGAHTSPGGRTEGEVLVATFTCTLLLLSGPREVSGDSVLRGLVVAEEEEVEGATLLALLLLRSLSVVTLGPVTAVPDVTVVEEGGEEVPWMLLPPRLAAEAAVEEAVVYEERPAFPLTM